MPKSEECTFETGHGETYIQPLKDLIEERLTGCIEHALNCIRAKPRHSSRRYSFRIHEVVV